MATSDHLASIMVMPFSGDPSVDTADYFARGLTEDLITQLTRFSALRVVSSQSAFAAEGLGRPFDEFARAWGVDYVLEGSAWRRGDSTRVAPRLVRTEDMTTVWADQIDAVSDEVFILQDRIVEMIAGKLSVQVGDQRLRRSRRTTADELHAYDFWLRGMDCLRQASVEGDAEARPLFEQAITIDPHFVLGYVGLSLSHFNEWSCQTWHLWDESADNAYDYAAKAVAVDDTNAMAHAVMARVLHHRREHDRAVAQAHRALMLNPNDPWVAVQAAIASLFNGDFDRAIELAEKALSCNPLHASVHQGLMGWAHFMAGRAGEALPLLEQGGDLIVNFGAYRAGCLVELGNLGAARQAYQHFLDEYQKKISFGRSPEPGEALAWAVAVEPFRNLSDSRRLPDVLAAHGMDSVDVEQAIKDCPRPMVRPAEIVRPERAVFTSENGIWSIDYEGAGAQLTEVKGFNDLARLLGEPTTHVHCLELYGGSGVQDSDQPVLDPESRQAYRRRLLELQQELAQAQSDHDPARADPLQRELEALTDELARTLGLRGRSRNMGDQAERARSAVTWRVRSAIKKIRAAHPRLGQHLANSVKTGVFCVYSPETPVEWQL
ncbi:MAG: tetratricopeptide repeat protein [Planctomycetota bacterium]|jgi:TolB-like protein